MTKTSHCASESHNVRRAVSPVTLTTAVLAALAGSTSSLAQSGQPDHDQGVGQAVGGLLNMLGGGADEAMPSQDNAAPQADTTTDEMLNGGVIVDDNMTVELHVQDEALANVLQMLSLQSQRNIVTSKEVSATVTANLYGVTFYEALDAILHVNGYGYIERGNFIYVYTIDELAAIEQATRQKEYKVIRLSFLNAVDAADFVSPLLSDDGTIKTNARASDFTDPTQPTGNEEFANESTLVIIDYPENIEAIETLITELDTRPAQILVEATIVQTSLNESNAFGVDFSIIGDLNFADFTSPLDGVDNLIKGNGAAGDPVPSDGIGRGVSSKPGQTSGSGTFKAGIIGGDVAVFLTLLDEASDTPIISNPKIVTLNRQPGRVLVGRKVGYLQTTSTDTATTQTVEFLDTGTQLNFRPFVTKDGLIRMELKPQVSEAQIRSATDATGAAVTIPDEITNELVTNILVPDGHTIVLGGLFRESTVAERRQVPVLGDIPIIGAAFRGHEDETDRQEIIFLITPSIVSDQVLVDQGMKGEDTIRRVRVGAREGLLPFSRERQSAQLVVEAQREADAGNTERALHLVRRALHLHPQQPDAIQLRERLLNEQSVWPTRSLLEDIVKTSAQTSLRAGDWPTSWTSGPAATASSSTNTPSTAASVDTTVAAESTGSSPMTEAWESWQALTADSSSNAAPADAQSFDNPYAADPRPATRTEVALSPAQPVEINPTEPAIDPLAFETSRFEDAPFPATEPADQRYANEPFEPLAEESGDFVEPVSDPASNTDPYPSEPTDSFNEPTDNSTEPQAQSVEFSELDPALTASAQPSDAGVQALDASRVPLYTDNPYVYFDASDAPTDFAPTTFQADVEAYQEASGDVETPSPLDSYLQYLQETSEYSNVSEDETADDDR